MKLPYTLLFLVELSPKIYFSYFPLDTTVTTDISNLLISNTNKTKIIQTKINLENPFLVQVH